MRIRTRFLILLVTVILALTVNALTLSMLAWVANDALRRMDVGVRQQTVALQMQAQLRDAEAALYRYLIEGEEGFAHQFERQMQKFGANVSAYSLLSENAQERAWSAVLKNTYRESTAIGSELMRLRDQQSADMAALEQAQAELTSLLAGPVRASRPNDARYQETVDKMHDSLRAMYVATISYLVAPGEESKNQTVRFSEAVISFREAYERFRSMAATPEEQDWAKRIGELFDKMENLGSRLISRRTLQTAQFANFAAILYHAGERILTGQIQPHAADTLSSTRERFLGTMKSAVAATLAIVVLTTLLAASVTIPMLRQMDADVLALLRGAERVASGDLDARVHVRGTGELKKLADAFNNMVAELAARDIRLRARHAELETLREVSLELTSTLDPEQVLHTIARGVQRLVGARVVRIFVFSERGEPPLRLAASTGKAEPPSHLPSIPTRDLVLEAARTGRPQVFGRSPEQAEPRRASPSVAAFPLRLGERVLGVFDLTFEDSHTLDEDSLRVLNLLADQAAIALENAHLYQDLADREERLYSLAQKLAHIQEEERRLVGLDLHDGLTQLLMSANMHLDAFSALVENLGEEARAELTLARARLHEALREARRVVSELRPAALEEFGLVDGIRQYLLEVAQRQNWQVEFDADPPEIRLEPSIENAVFRICQEAITNVRRHAQSKRIRVVLRATERNLSLVVQDWGRGFDPATVSEGHLGLLGMRERAALLGGECHIDSRPGKGTTVRVSIPIQWVRRNANVRQDFGPRR